MEEKKSSTTASATATTTRTSSGSSSVYMLHLACFLHQPLKAILKCLGHEISQQNPDDNDGNTVNDNSTSPRTLDPHSTSDTADPRAITILVRRPPRRPIKGGSGGQIN